MKWRCGVCGYVWDGSEAPANCPKCGAPREKFEKIPDDKAQLIDRSRFTNGLHMQLSALLDSVIEIAKKGINDNLDPPCVGIFTKTQEQAKTIQQMIKAEIVGHIGKGKWG